MIKILKITIPIPLIVMMLIISITITLVFFFKQLSKYKMVKLSHDAHDYLDNEKMQQKKIKNILVHTDVKKTKIKKE